MNQRAPLAPADFAHVIRLTPLVSIDLIVKDDRGQVLLGRRRNAPAKGYWFVPGGRIHKGESLTRALQRIVQKELGVLEADGASFLGVYEHIYDDNVFGDPSFGTHYIVLAHQVELEINARRMPMDEHSEFEWWETQALLKSGEVHPFTKAYFRDQTSDFTS